MRKRLLPVFVSLMMPIAFCSTVLAAQPTTARILADQSYSDFVKYFWEGSSGAGHLKTYVPELRHVASLWELSQGVNVIWSYWKLTGSADAARRIQAWWSWAQKSEFGKDFSGCGSGTINNGAQDDLAWNVGAFLRVYEIARDRRSLTAAKEALDCAYSRWWDTSFEGGGYWYTDEHVNKSSYQLVLLVDTMWYYDFTGDIVYQHRALEGERWAVAHLRRTGAGLGNPNDGLFWCDLMAGTRTWDGVNSPYQVSEGASQTGLYANMSAAVLDERLYDLTGTPVYLGRLRQTANGIRRYEVEHVGRSDILLNDRDASDDAFSIFQFSSGVLPLLPTAERTAWVALLHATAESIMAHDRAQDGTYGGSWAGPPDGNYKRISFGKVIRQDLRISAQAAAVVIAAAANK
jgi:hypothetical protein